MNIIDNESPSSLWIRSAAIGVGLGAAASFSDNVPLLLGEVGKARADRSGWSQIAEFGSLILDSGWAWAATAVLVGWLASAGTRPKAAALTGAATGFVSLVVATLVFYGLNFLLKGSFWWGQVIFWWVRSFALGAPLGIVGALIRRPGIAGVIASFVVPAGAVLNMVVLPLPEESPMATPVLLLVCGSAAVAAVLIAARAIRARGAR